MVKGISHLAVNAKDMEKSLDFYTRALGFKKAFEIEHQQTGKPWIVYLHAGGRQFVELFYTDEPNKPLDPWGDKLWGFNHICMEVDDIHAIAAHIESCGYEVFIKPQQGSDGNWQCWTMDPNGVRVELMQLGQDGLQMKVILEACGKE